MSDDLLGKVCSLLNAITWAFALVFFKRSGERLAPVALNLFKNVVALLLLGATLLLLPLLPGRAADVMPLWLADPASPKLWMLLLSGVLGIAVADTIFFASLNLAGVGIIAIVDCLYTPLVMVFSWWLLAERLVAAHYVGAALIVTAVVVAVGVGASQGRTRRQVVIGVLGAAFSLALMAFAIVIAKPALEDAPVFWTTSIRLASGTIVLIGFGAFTPGISELRRVFRPSPVWKTAIPGSVLGAYLAMVFWIAGFAYTQASVAAMLNQTSTIFALVLARILLAEPLTPRKIAAVALALGGVAIVVVNSATP